MTGDEIQTFLTAFVVLGLISVAGTLLALRWAQARARDRGEPVDKPDRTAWVSSVIVGVIIWAAVALTFVLMNRTAHP